MKNVDFVGNRTENANRNMFFGLLTRIITIFLPFVLRTVMINVLGVEYVGLNTICTSVLGFLSLAELGFGSAMVYCMYMPIANGEDEEVCALLALYKKIYRIIGIVIFVIGLALVPVLPYLIKYDTNLDVNVYIIYLVSLISTSITYFIGGYKTSLLVALQRNDIQSKVESCLLVFRYSVEIILLFVFKNYYIYIIIAPIYNALLNLLIVHITNVKYPQYFATGCVGEKEKAEIVKKVKSLFLYNIGQVISSYADTFVISAFLGVKLLGMYQNYYIVITMLFGFLQVFYNSIQAGIGNMIATENREYIYSVFKTLFLFQVLLCGWLSICLVCLYQPFINLWLGDNFLLSFSIPVLLSLNFYQWKVRDIVQLFKNAGGLWEKDRYCPLISSIVNLTLNLFLVQIWGLPGVIVSTFLAGLLIETPWSASVLYRGFFCLPTSLYIKKLMFYSFIIGIIGSVAFMVTTLINLEGIVGFILKGTICTILVLLSYYFIFRNNMTFNNIIIRGKRSLENIKSGIKMSIDKR